MRIVVLGANGQLGQDLLRMASDQGRAFKAFTRKEVSLFPGEPQFEFLKQECFDVLVNCTAYNRVDEAESQASQAFVVNAQAVGKLAEICHLKKARFLHLSTDYVFNGFSKEPYLETDAPGPLNVYGASKLMGENLALSMSCQTWILRVASLFGIAGSSGKGGNFVETMIRLAKEKGELRVVSDITMSPTSTTEVARLILKLIDQEIPFGIYHAVNAGSASWYEFAAEIIRQAKINASVIPISSRQYPTAALRPSYSVLNHTRLGQLIGLSPPWQIALEEYLYVKGHL